MGCDRDSARALPPVCVGVAVTQLAHLTCSALHVPRARCTLSRRRACREREENAKKGATVTAIVVGVVAVGAGLFALWKRGQKSNVRALSSILHLIFYCPLKFLLALASRHPRAMLLSTIAST